LLGGFASVIGATAHREDDSLLCLREDWSAEFACIMPLIFLWWGSGSSCKYSVLNQGRDHGVFEVFPLTLNLLAPTTVGARINT